MDDIDLAALMDEQTRMIWLLAEMLIDRDVINRGELVDALYILLQQALDKGAAPMSGNAFKHMIQLLEHET